ncbi:MAG: cysteine hydrolase [Clostridiales bacterium]|jgi:nicotinamidase-related amidase|nr:cysteine hydrolase [Clostridiales bacterium]
MKVLIIVDMQNDFITGPLGSPEAAALVPRAVSKIRGFQGKVLVTLDTHGDNYLQTQEGRNLPVVHCVKDTEGWNIHPGILEALRGSGANFSERDGVFMKPAFGSVSLAEALLQIDAANKIDEIELAGICTDICVISNALIIKAVLPDVLITVDAACCAGVTPQSHLNALSAMKACQIRVINE